MFGLFGQVSVHDLIYWNFFWKVEYCYMEKIYLTSLIWFNCTFTGFSSQRVTPMIQFCSSVLHPIPPVFAAEIRDLDGICSIWKLNIALRVAVVTVVAAFLSWNLSFISSCDILVQKSTICMLIYQELKSVIWIEFTASLLLHDDCSILQVELLMWLVFAILWIKISAPCFARKTGKNTANSGSWRYLS